MDTLSYVFLRYLSKNNTGNRHWRSPLATNVVQQQIFATNTFVSIIFDIFSELLIHFDNRAIH